MFLQSGVQASGPEFSAHGFRVWKFGVPGFSVAGLCRRALNILQLRLPIGDLAIRFMYTRRGRRVAIAEKCTEGLEVVEVLNQALS